MNESELSPRKKKEKRKAEKKRGASERELF